MPIPGMKITTAIHAVLMDGVMNSLLPISKIVAIHAIARNSVNSKHTTTAVANDGKTLSAYLATARALV
jgi:hypothetical protein